VVGLKIAELLLNNIHIWRNENEEKDGTYGNTLERKPGSQQV
jgi:hypothetical protein